MEPERVGSRARVPGEGPPPPIQELEGPTHTAVAKVPVRVPPRVSQLLAAMVSWGRPFAVPPQLVRASRHEEPSAPEMLERARERPRAAARMVPSAERALSHWARGYLGTPLARGQMAI